MANNLIEEFRCALSSQPHYFIKPVSLVCGHCVCRDCIPKEENITMCLICNTITTQDIRNSNESIMAKKAMKMSMQELLESMQVHFFGSLQKLKGLRRKIT